tara:strand:+ start:760 stop:1461 length:702 start_codon:yes stop_codon:yes gene_type:complete
LKSINNNVEVVVFITPEYFEMYTEIFEKTLPSEVKDVTVYYKRLPPFTNYTNKHKNLYKRVATYADHVRGRFNEVSSPERPPHMPCIDKVLFVDVDIIFYDNFVKQTCDILDDYDMAFQGDVPQHPIKWYCGGIWGIRCNQESVHFLDNILLPAISPTSEEFFARQEVGYPEKELNDILFDLENYDTNIKVTTFPSEFGFPVEGSLMYHAVGQYATVHDKMIKLSQEKEMRGI